MNPILIAYYTGTGGTQKAAELLCQNLINKGTECSLLRIKSYETIEIQVHQKLVLMFPIHDFSAPLATYQWIEKLPSVHDMNAFVITISGGGEMLCNTAARVGVIHRLEEKGYNVIFEDTVVMPCNCIIQTPPAVSKLLLNLLPLKTDQLSNAIQNDERHRLHPLKIDYHLAKWGDSIKSRTAEFGEKILVKESCTGCGICVSNCPSSNIKIENKRASFSCHCEMCLCCLYSCPHKSLEAQTGKFMVLKNGFSLRAIEKEKPASFEQAPKLLKGLIWKGVRNYIQSLENP